MARGGARVRSGPAAKPDAIRRDLPSDKARWTHLPASGRTGDPPAWPLIRPTERELVLWATEWTRPQAVAWEQLGLEVEVAMYVRTLRCVERPGAKGVNASLLGKLLQQQNSLGLTVGGMSANGWVIDDAGAARPEPQRREPEPERRASKDRLLELVVNQ